MQRLSASQRSFLQEAAKRYAASLPGSPAAEYLTGRQLFDGTKKFGLGYVENPLPGHEPYRGYLAIPYLRQAPGQPVSVVSIRYRCIEDHEHQGHGKYLTAPGDRPRLFNTAALLVPSDFVCVTEGELDAVTAELCGLPTIGVPGAESWQEHFREALLGYETVYVIADGDDAGRRFANVVASSLPNGKVIPCPPGEDTNSLVLKYGRAALLDRIHAIE